MASDREARIKTPIIAVSIIIALVIGVIAGYVGSSLTLQQERLITTTIVKTLPGTTVTTTITAPGREVTKVVTLTKTVTNTAQRPPPPRLKIIIADASDAFSFHGVQENLVVQKFKEMGYQAEHALLGVRGSVSAFLAREAQIILITPQEMIRAVEKGEDIILIGPGAVLGYFLAARSEVKSVKDLEGRTVGISRPGAISDLIPRFIMRRAGVDLDKVKFVSVGGSSARARALLAGRIDAGMLWADLAVRTAKQSGGAVRLLASVSDVAPGRSPDSEWIFVHREWADKNPNIVKDFLRAKLLAEMWIVNNRDEFVKFASQLILEKTDKESIDFYKEVYDLYRGKGWLPFTSIDVDSLNITLEMAKEAGAVEGTVPIERIIERKYLDEVIDGLLRYQVTI